MTSKTAKPRTVLCPTCGGISIFSPENSYRPFCSKRCKLIDLGQWANEEFRIPETTQPLPDEEVE
ncbi:MAG: DNA gyrase inhibitor YacG [Sulfuricellaceae bacterium]|nr:DNA gyrase inhibitor YacG [Sulfuricellaceae bacterium]